MLLKESDKYAMMKGVGVAIHIMDSVIKINKNMFKKGQVLGSLGEEIIGGKGKGRG